MTEILSTSDRISVIFDSVFDSISVIFNLDFDSIKKTEPWGSAPNPAFATWQRVGGKPPPTLNHKRWSFQKWSRGFRGISSVASLLAVFHDPLTISSSPDLHTPLISAFKP